MKSDVQETKEGKTGITKLKLLFSKHEVEGELSFHFFDDRWRLLGLDIQLPPKKLGEPPDFKVCQVPMDLSSAMSKLAERIRKRQYDTIFEEAESALKASKGKEDFATMMQSHEQTFGRFVRQLDVLSCWHNSSGTRYNTVMVYEYAHAQRKAVTMWGLVGNQWKLLSYKVVSKS